MGVDDIILNEYNKTDFESLCAGILRQAKLWQTDRTGKTRDGGKDLVMTTDKGKTVYVECKAWSERVTPKEIRAFHSVCVTDRVDGYFISVSGFTPQALEEAKTKKIRTLDASDLMAMIRSYDAYKHPILFSSSEITMDNAKKNKVGVIKLTNTLIRTAIVKAHISVDGVDSPPVKADNVLYVAVPNGKHDIKVKIGKEVLDTEIDLKGFMSFSAKTKVLSKTGYEIIVETF